MVFCPYHCSYIWHVKIKWTYIRTTAHTSYRVATTSLIRTGQASFCLLWWVEIFLSRRRSMTAFSFLQIVCWRIISQHVPLSLVFSSQSRNERSGTGWRDWTKCQKGGARDSWRWGSRGKRWADISQAKVCPPWRCSCSNVCTRAAQLYWLHSTAAGGLPRLPFLCSR